ncbi:MAG: cation transporter [Candidatus Omnitrophica bacterium]|nr:cation transporter [Candidatus Omnitrophota bacterium]
MRIAIVSILVNLCLSAAKISAGLLGNSYALIADGIESLLDIFSSTVVWGGLKIGSLPPDDNHPYGHGKAESLAAMIVSCVLLFVATAIVIQSIKEIFLPHHAPASFTLVVLIVVVIIKEIFYRVVLKVGEEIGSLSIKSDAWHHRSDALTSLAAFVGIFIALVGGKGWESADDWAALFASGIIYYNGLKMWKAAVADIMDEDVSADLKEKVRSAAKNTPGVVDIEKCRIRKSGLDFLVDIHIVVSGMITVKDGHAIAHDVKNRLLAANIHVVDVMTHVEPDHHPEGA